MSVGSLRAPSTSGASLPSDHLTYSPFGQGHVQNGIPASAAPVQRYIQEEEVITKACLGRLMLGLDLLRSKPNYITLFLLW